MSASKRENRITDWRAIRLMQPGRPELLICSERVYNLNAPRYKTSWSWSDGRSIDRTNERTILVIPNDRADILNTNAHCLALYLQERWTKSLLSSTSFMASFESSIAPLWAKTALRFWALKGDFSDPPAPSERRIVSSISHWTVLWPSPHGITSHLLLNRTDNLMTLAISLQRVLGCVKQKVWHTG